MTPPAVLAGEALWAVLEGDCVTLDLPLESIDAVVSDPPAGIGFMGKDWDHHKGGRDEWIAWMTERMRVAFRLLKPGGHALIWALPRTSHWTATAIEDAGFEVRDVLTHLFGSGFPKSLDVSKAIDSAAGAVRAVVGTVRKTPSAGGAETNEGWTRPWAEGKTTMDITAPATPEAAQWQGWGTALKPAVERWILAEKPAANERTEAGSEDWILARKPLIGTVAANVLAHGTGGINVDACRVGFRPGDTTSSASSAGLAAHNRHGRKYGDNLGGIIAPPHSLGRWPTNLLLTHSEGCREVGTRQIGSGEATRVGLGRRPRGMGETGERNGDPIPNGPTYGTETITAYDCVPDCPIGQLDQQSGDRPGMSGGGKHRESYGGGMFGGVDSTDTARADSGGASRFYPTFRYVPKAPRAMREAGLQAAENERANDHPTVKNDDLMRWLVRLITPTGGVVLDMFCGSGSTGRAALLEGCRFIGIDDEAHYVEIAKARIKDVEPKPERQLTIFELLAS